MGEAKRIVLQDAPPEGRLGLEPVVTSLEDLDAAAAEMSHLVSRQMTIDAVHKQNVALLATETKAKKTTVIGDVTLPIADRLQALDAAIRKFAADNPDAVRDGGKKSRELAHCTVGFESTHLKLSWMEGCTETTAAKNLASLGGAAKGVAAAILAALKKIKLAGKITADQVTRVKTEVDRVAAKKLYERGLLKARDLKKLQLEPVLPRDEFYLTLKDWPAPAPPTVTTAEDAAA